MKSQKAPSGFDVKLMLKLLLGGTMVQASSALVGFALAHWMSIQDYALYSVMTAMVGAVSVLTSAGTHLGVAAILGRVWPDKDQASQAISSALAYRKRISLVVLPVVIGAAHWMLIRNGADLPVALVLDVLLLVFWFSDFTARTIERVLPYAGQAGFLQRLDTVVALLRLLSVLALRLGATVSVAVVSLITACLNIGRAIFVRNQVDAVLGGGPSKKPSAFDHEISSISNRQLALEVFYVLQGQIMFIVLAWFGGSAQTAAIGALSRIAQILVPFQSVMTLYLIPRFTASGQEGVGSQLFRTLMLYSVPPLILVLIAWLAPESLLILVGPNYENQVDELQLYVLVAGLYAVASCFWSLLAHRGANRFAWLQIPVAFLWWWFVATRMDLSTVKAAIVLSFSMTLGLLVSGAMDYFGARKNA